jgi:Nucleotidyl transferase AbiEii toxin, Type IV TA system
MSRSLRSDVEGTAEEQKVVLLRIASIRFWQRCETLQPQSWMIKGAQALALRAGAARATLDLDMLTINPNSPDPVADVEELVRDAANVTLPDGFEFKVRKVQPLSESRTLRARLVVRLEGRKLTSELTIDLGYRRYEPAIIADVVQPQLHVPGYSLPPVALYPLPQHVADKTCAMFEIVNGEESDRHHDLFDLVWIATSFAFDRSELSVALGNEQQRRGVTVPVPFTPPSQLWRDGFTLRVRREPTLTSGWPPFDEAMAIVDRFLNGAPTDQQSAWDPEPANGHRRGEQQPGSIIPKRQSQPDTATGGRHSVNETQPRTTITRWSSAALPAHPPSRPTCRRQERFADINIGKYQAIYRKSLYGKIRNRQHQRPRATFRSLPPVLPVARGARSHDWRRRVRRLCEV